MRAPKTLTTSIVNAFLLLFLLSTLNSNAQIPAFPGAEGYGKYAIGGRGGQVIKVTNLNDSGPGSFREACESSGPRTVIFEVGGRINLNSTIEIIDPFITIAGQSAPGDGITLSIEGTPNEPVLSVKTNDVVIRYITIRRSEFEVSEQNSDGLVLVNANKVIVDHCSFSWASDENVAIYDYDGNGLSNTHSITLQNCLLSTAWGGNDKGVICSGGVDRLSFYRNFFTNINQRNPLIKTETGNYASSETYFEIINNIVYDAKQRTSLSNNVPESGTMHLNFINNFHEENAGGSYQRRALQANGDYPVSIFVQGNMSPIRQNISSPVDWDEEWTVTMQTIANGTTEVGEVNSYPFVNTDYQVTTPKPTPIITDGAYIINTEDLFNELKSHVGASLPTRDSYDAQRITDFENLASTEGNVSGTYPTINNGTPLPDTDNDGMPDVWEISEFGDLTSDGIIDSDGDGYTDLEEYLNQTANGQIPEVPAEDVSITPETQTINIPETVQLNKVFTPINTTNQTGDWSSSDNNIAIVNSIGLVTPVAPGTVTITFVSNDGGFSDTSTITVTNDIINVTSLELTPETLSLDVNQTESLTVNFFPENATDQSGTWVSDNPSVVSVDDNGNVTGIVEGTSEITFTSNDGGFSDTTIVTVNDVMFGTYDFYNAETDEVIQQITGDTSFDLGVIGNQVNFRCIPQGGDNNPDVESVEVIWTGVESGSHTESYAIYMGMATHTDSDIFPYTVVAGTYNFTINYYDEDDTNGELVSSDNFSITFFDDAVLTANAGSDQSICEGESTTLTATGGTDYLWSTGETSASISVSPNQTTTYSVTVSNDAGETDTDDVIVNVSEIPIADAGSDQTICEGETVTLTANGGSSYLWSTGETTASINVVPNFDTTYTVEVFENNCSNSDDITVFVTQAPEITVSQDVTIIEGESTTLTVEGALSYVWSTGETSDSITVSPAQTTTYNVTGTSNSCSAQAEITVTVQAGFEANAGENQRVCENDDYSVTLTANQGDSYLWSTGETTQSIIVSPLSTTEYTVTVTSDNISDTDSVTVYVDPNPNVNITNGDNVDILSGDFITLSATGANTYEWNNGATQPNIAVSPSQTTTYEVRGYINDCYDEKQVTVNVYQEVQANAGEDVTICLDDSVVLTASGGDEYLWSTGETTQSIEVSPSITTDYYVTVFNPMHFDEASVRVEVDAECDVAPTNPGEEVSGFGMDIYPNPADRFVDIDVHGTFETSEIEIYDITGKMVLKKEIQNENAYSSITKRINISQLEEGIYVLRLLDENRDMTKKLIVN